MPLDLLDPFQQKNDPPKKSWDEVFSKRNGGGSGGNSRKNTDADLASQIQAEAEEEFAKDDKVKDPPPSPKPEVSLFNPQWGGDQGVFNRKISVSVQGSLPPESSHLTRVSFTVNALLPNGKLDRVDAQDAHLVDGKATAEVTLFTPNYRDQKGNLLNACDYAFKAKHRDGKELESAKLPVKDKKDVVHRVRLSGMIFDANKCFPLPEALGGISSILRKHGSYPQAQLLLVGHAGGDEDVAGSALAFERAQMLGAYLKGKPNSWLNQFGPGKNARSRWGTRELQLMLSVLPAGGAPFYAGNASGLTDAKTVAALKAFQESTNKEKGASLPTDGKGDFETRQALVEAYMELAGTKLGEEVTPIAHGVEGHCEDGKTASGMEVDDRRFEAFCFEQGIKPQPAASTSQAGSGPYSQWLENLADTEDFENHGIHVQIVDAQKQPVPFADVQLKGPVSAQARSDEHGFVSFTGLKKGDYLIGSEKNGYRIGTSKLAYPTAKTMPGYVKTGSGK
jgi:hypothetical protein